MTIIPWIVVGLLLLTSVGLLLSRDWRWSLGLLAAQYLGMFYLVTLHWPFSLASVKLVTGWMASATIGVTRLGMSENEVEEESSWPRGRLFRLFADLNASEHDLGSVRNRRLAGRSDEIVVIERHAGPRNDLSRRDCRRFNRLLATISHESDVTSGLPEYFRARE